MYENKVIIIGNLTKKPELRDANGIRMCGLNIAVNSTWTDKDSGEKKESVEFISVTVFRKQAEICAQWLDKGQKVYVEGKIKNRVEEREGEKRYHTGIIADKVQFGAKSAPKDENDNRSTYAEQPRTATPTAPNNPVQKSMVGNTGIEYPTEDINPDDIPF
ncbi:MAG: single-stranded DNA-binding protein [bacterium]|nr:single-stranded DNA-binding protein [bacterium]